MNFKDISYFWSKEFIGTMRVICRRPWQRKALALVLTTATLLGPTVGPASAILLIPRKETWKAGGTDFWINATEERIWPSRFHGDMVSPECHTSPEKFTCPSSQWEQIGYYAQHWKYINGSVGDPGRSYSTGPLELPQRLHLQSQFGVREMILSAGAWHPTFAAATVPSLPIANALLKNEIMWLRAVRQNRKSPN